MNINESKGVTLAVLERAKSILASPERWTKHFYAKDALGWKAAPASDKAVCFCSLGAIRRAYYEVCDEECNDSSDAAMLLQSVSHQRFGMVVEGLNDHISTRHENILDLFDKAIEEINK